MLSVQSPTLHPDLSARRRLRYVFTPKHHGADARAACWLSEITLTDEFAVFDRSYGIVVRDPADDDRQVADSNGNLYGYERLPDGTFRELGAWYEQIAEFPIAEESIPWHGYPIWPLLAETAPSNRRGQVCRPEKSVFSRMLQLGDITPQMRKRLCKGDRI